MAMLTRLLQQLMRPSVPPAESRPTADNVATDARAYVKPFFALFNKMYREPPFDARLAQPRRARLCRAQPVEIAAARAARQRTEIPHLAVDRLAGQVLEEVVVQGHSAGARLGAIVASAAVICASSSAISTTQELLQCLSFSITCR